MGKTWRRQLDEVILQEPLIETKASLIALKHLPLHHPPGAVFIGIGLGTSTRLSDAVPLDILGILLPAERIRLAIGAPSLEVLVADAHTHTNGFDRHLVEQHAIQVTQTLERIRGALSLKEMNITRASTFHDTVEYRRVLDQLQGGGSNEDHPYFKLEVADVQYMNWRYGGVLKVGWTIGPSTKVLGNHDEAAFDRRYLRWVGRQIGFVYCKAGRVLDDRRPKASPYLTLNAARRLCLRAEEHVATKIANARIHTSEETVRGVKNHLRKIRRCYSKIVEPLRGTWNQQVQSIISTIAENDSGAVRPCGR